MKTKEILTNHIENEAGKTKMPSERERERGRGGPYGCEMAESFLVLLPGDHRWCTSECHARHTVGAQ